MAFLEVKVDPQSPRKEKLTSATLQERWWWRFAQIIFVLTTIFFIGADLVLAGAAMNSADLVDKELSVLSCSGGQSINLADFGKATDTPTYSLAGVTGDRFSYYQDDTMAKVFCAALNRDLASLTLPGETLSPEQRITMDALLAAQKEIQTEEQQAGSVAQYVVTNGGYSYIKDISERDVSLEGEDLSYSITVVSNYTEIAEIIGLFFLALAIEVVILIVIRGMARYTLIGKFN